MTEAVVNPEAVNKSNWKDVFLDQAGLDLEEIHSAEPGIHTYMAGDWLPFALEEEVEGINVMDDIEFYDLVTDSTANPAERYDPITSETPVIIRYTSDRNYAQALMTAFRFAERDSVHCPFLLPHRFSKIEDTVFDKLPYSTFWEKEIQSDIFNVPSEIAEITEGNNSLLYYLLSLKFDREVELDDSEAVIKAIMNDMEAPLIEAQYSVYEGGPEIIPEHLVSYPFESIDAFPEWVYLLSQLKEGKQQDRIINVKEIDQIIKAPSLRETFPFPIHSMGVERIDGSVYELFKQLSEQYFGKLYPELLPLVEKELETRNVDLNRLRRDGGVFQQFYVEGKGYTIPEELLMQNSRIAKIYLRLLEIVEN